MSQRREGGVERVMATKSLTVSNPGPSSLTLKQSWHHLVAGGVGGMVGAVVTSPLEVVKTRLQSSTGTSLLTSYGHVRTVSAPAVVRYSRIWSTLTHIVINEGAGGLFKGLGPTLLGNMLIMFRLISIFNNVLQGWHRAEQYISGPTQPASQHSMQ